MNYDICSLRNQQKSPKPFDDVQYKNKELPSITIPGVGIRFRPADLDKYIERHLNKSFSSFLQSIDNKENTLTIPPDYDRILSGGNSEMPKGKNKTRYNFGFGAIYQRKTSKGKIRWYLDYRDAEGKRVQRVAPLATTKEEAVIALREETRKIFDREYQVKRQIEKIKFSKLTNTFLENYAKPNKKSWKGDEYRLQANLKPFFGDFLLQEITPLMIEQYRAQRLKDKVSKSTVNREISIMKRMFNLAIDWNLTKDNPTNKVKPYSEKGCLMERILTKEEEVCLLKAASSHLRPILVIALNTGMRRGEILNLHWSQIDLDAKEIKVVQTKSGEPRIVDINSVLYEELVNLKEKGIREHYLFINPKTGKPFKKVPRSFKSACKKAGIESLRFHDLRHTFASRLVAKGVDIIRVKELLGHSTVKITERYTHSNREDRKRAVELLCQKPGKIVEKWEKLLPICDMDPKKKSSKSVSSLFSIN